MQTDLFMPSIDWKIAQYQPELKAQAGGHQIMEALDHAVLRFNAGVATVENMNLVGKPAFRTGKLHIVSFADAMGTTGAYPSANMALIIDGEPARKGGRHVYPAGAKLCFVHCRWRDRDMWPENDLPMHDDFYRSVRRTMAGLLEFSLRQQGM
jgi:hypothetical protein